MHLSQRVEFSSNCFVFWKFVSVLEPLQCRTQSIFGDTVYLCYCEFRLVTLPWWELRGQKLLILTTLDCWERHFREQNYIENYFYFIKSTKSTKPTPQKCWRNIIWADFFLAPILVKWYQNTSEFAGALKKS